MTEKKPLPGWVYMIVGLAIMGYTRFIQARQPASTIGFFFWVGLVFLIWGVLREFVPRILAKRQKKEHVGPPHQAAHAPHNHLHPGGNAQHGVSNQMTHHHLKPQQHPSHPYQPLHKQCPRCQKLTHGQGKFCHNCGHQFF